MNSELYILEINHNCLDCSYYRWSWILNLKSENMSVRSITCITETTETGSVAAKTSIVPNRKRRMEYFEPEKGSGSLLRYLTFMIFSSVSEAQLSGVFFRRLYDTLIYSQRSLVQITKSVTRVVNNLIVF